MATGVGARGLQEYKFSLDLLNEIDYEKIKSINNDNKVDVFLPKKSSGFWSRLVNAIKLDCHYFYNNYLYFLDLPATKAILVES
jgi:hypothetical protein